MPKSDNPREAAPAKTEPSAAGRLTGRTGGFAVLDRILPPRVNAQEIAWREGDFAVPRRVYAQVFALAGAVSASVVTMAQFLDIADALRFPPPYLAGKWVSEWTGSRLPLLIGSAVTWGLIALCLLALVAARGKAAGPTRSSGRGDEAGLTLLQVLAIEEERRFREGAEHWTWRQRLTSCVVFGGMHITNIIVPMMSLALLAVGGAALMARYLRTFRKTGSREAAVRSSVQLHYAYNRVVIFLIPVLIIGQLAALFLLGRL